MVRWRLPARLPEFENAQAISLTLDGHTYTGTISSGTWSVTAPAADVSALVDGSYNVHASVSDLAGNVAVIDRPISVDTTAPTVSSITTSGAGINVGGDGDLNAGHIIALTVNVSEAVAVTGGSPTLTLNDGATASYDAVHSTATKLAFNYTVQPGENTPDLRVWSRNFDGAVIQDLAGNAEPHRSKQFQSSRHTDSPIPPHEPLSIGTIAGDNVIDGQRRILL